MVEGPAARVHRAGPKRVQSVRALVQGHVGSVKSLWRPWVIVDVGACGWLFLVWPLGMVREDRKRGAEVGGRWGLRGRQTEQKVVGDIRVSFGSDE